MTSIGKGLTKAEREVVIQWSEDDQYASVYTSSRLWARKFTKILETYPDPKVMYHQGGLVFQIPVKAITLRKRTRLSTQERTRRQRQAQHNFSGAEHEHCTTETD